MSYISEWRKKAIKEANESVTPEDPRQLDQFGRLIIEDEDVS